MIVEAGTMNIKHDRKTMRYSFHEIVYFLLKTLAVLINQSKRTVKSITSIFRIR